MLDDRHAFSPARSRGLPVADGKHIAPFQVHVDRCERFIPANWRGSDSLMRDSNAPGSSTGMSQGLAIASRWSRP